MSLPWLAVTIYRPPLIRPNALSRSPSLLQFPAPQFSTPTMLNLLIPGKGQVQFYKTSNFGKLRGILVGLASYYFTYEMLNSLDDYNYYDNQYKDYFELYGSETDADLIEYYRIEADKNAKLSNSSRSEVSKFALISGVLFSLNAIEITMIHIEF